MEEKEREKAESENEQQRRGIKKAREQLNTVQEGVRSLARMATAANAGGAIATLSVIGTALGVTDGKGPVPQPLFWVLVLFVIGICTAWLHRFFELEHAALELGDQIDMLEGKRSDPPRPFIWRRRWIFFLKFTPILCAYYGMTEGLKFLFTLTG